MLSEPYLNIRKSSREKSENMELMFYHAVAVLSPQSQSEDSEPDVLTFNCHCLQVRFPR